MIIINGIITNSSEKYLENSNNNFTAETDFISSSVELQKALGMSRQLICH